MILSDLGRILGRVWYQGEWSEGVVVWGSLIVHVGSGILKRAVKSFERVERRKRRRIAEKSKEESRVSIETIEVEGEEAEEEVEVVKASTLNSLLGLVTIQHVTGYLLIPIALHHSWLHRLLPATQIHKHLSPTLISYSFVSYSLSKSYALVSAIGYASVLSLGSYHSLSGIRRILFPISPIGLGRRTEKDSQAWKVGFVGLLATVGLGVVRLSADRTTPNWLGKRFDAVLVDGFLY